MIKNTVKTLIFAKLIPHENDKNTVFLKNTVKHSFCETHPILAFFSWKYLIFSLFQNFAFEWDKKGLKSYIYVCHGSMHHKNSTLVSKMNSSSDSQITQLGKSLDLNNRFFLIQKIMKIVKKREILWWKYNNEDYYKQITPISIG